MRMQPLQSVTTDSGSLVWLPLLRPLSLAFWEVEEAASAESLRLLTALGALPLGGLDGVIAPRFFFRQRSGRWHLFRQRRLGQRSSVLGSLRHHLFFDVGAGVGTRAALHHHSLNTVANTRAQRITAWLEKRLESWPWLSAMAAVGRREQYTLSADHKNVAWT